MYRELLPFREALSQELKTALFPAAAGVDPDQLLETYLDRLTCTPASTWRIRPSPR